MSKSALKNPFLILGLSPAYRIDRDQIERAYRHRLAGAHPDAGATSGQGHDPAALNEARSVLLSDEQRAIALLGVLGGPGASECKDMPDGFLMDMMTRRQAIEEAIESGGEDEREQWEQWGIEQRHAYRETVGTMFEAFTQNQDHGLLSEIRGQLNAWRYIERLIEQLDPEYDPAQADFE